MKVNLRKIIKQHLTLVTTLTSFGLARQSQFALSGILGPSCSVAQKQPWTLWSWDREQGAGNENGHCLKIFCSGISVS